MGRHRVCFRALIKEQHERNLGPILCGFMVGDDAEAIAQGFDKFIGDSGMIDTTGMPKLRPEEVMVCQPDLETYIARGQSRTGRPVSPEHATNCHRRYGELAGKWAGRILVFGDLSEILS